MATGSENEEVTRVEVTPATDDELVEGSPAPEGEGEPGEGEPEVPATGPDGRPEQLIHNEPPPAPAAGAPAAPAAGAPAAPAPAEGAPKKLEGETDKEYALRLEVGRLRGVIRGNRATEITADVIPPGQVPQRELTPEEKAVMDQYEKNPRDKAAIDALTKVFPILAKRLGFVRAEDITQDEQKREAQTTLNTFVEKHPEYLPENDPDGIFWGRFTELYKMYRPPSNARDMGKLLDRVHNEVFGVQAPGNLPGVAAAQRKVEVASHAGAPASAAPARPAQRASAAPPGVRLDMLKGFTQEELDAMK